MTEGVKQPDDVICAETVRLAGGPVFCGFKRELGKECPNVMHHIHERCPRCESPQPQLHPAVQREGEVHVCPHPWHSSTHAGREMMNKLVGHAYFDQHVQGVLDRAKVDRGAAAVIAEISAPGLGAKTTAPDDSTLPGAGRRSYGPTLQPGSRAETAMPVAPSALGREGFRQVLLRDVQYAAAALVRLQASINLAGKVLEPDDDAEGQPTRKPWDGPEHGQVGEIRGAPGQTFVYLCKMAPDGPGWYPIGSQAIGPLVDQMDQPTKQHDGPVFFHDELGHRARSEQARADFRAAQQAYEVDEDGDLDITPGGTVTVEHGEHGDDEMPGMWSESDVR